MPSNVTWLGRALPVQEIRDYTFGGTWLSGETITLTINGKDLTMTVGTDVAITDILDAVVDMWNDSDVENLVGDEGRNGVGANIPEFNEITASKVGTTKLRLTHDTAGVPFVVSASTDSASGTISSVSVTRAATGPNHADDVNNWDGGALPATGDSIWIGGDSPSILYGLSAITDTVASVNVAASYRGEIGLPQWNDLGYAEYRDCYWTLRSSLHRLGHGDGPGSRLLKFNNSSVQAVVECHTSASPREVGGGSIVFKGTHASNELRNYNSDVAVAIYGGEAATIATLYQSGGTFRSGHGATIGAASVNGGNAEFMSSATSLTQRGGSTKVVGSGTVGTLDVQGGSCKYETSGTATTVTVGGTATRATIDLHGDLRAKTFSSCTLNPGGSISAPPGVLTITSLSKGSKVTDITAN